MASGTYLSRKQIGQLLRPINPNRVGKRDNIAHLEAYDVRAHLNRVFGSARWSGDAVDATLLYEEPRTLNNGKPGYAVAYRCTYRLTIHGPDGAVLATYTEAATGDGVMPDSKRADAHDFAIKTAESQALKRCAINLGDQFGLSLYNRGSVMPLVAFTLAPDPARITPDGPQWADEQPQEQPHEDVTEHITTPLAPETPGPEPEQQTSTPPAADPPGRDTDDDEAEGMARSIRDRALAAKDTTNPRATLTKLLNEAAKNGVAKRLVYDADDLAMSLDALIQREIATTARRTA